VRRAHGRASLGQLRLLGLVAPILFIAVLLTARPVVVRHAGLDQAHAILALTLLLGATAFGAAMYRLLDRAHTDLVEAERDNAALVERERIARELHDSLAQVLGAAHLRLRGLEGRPEVAGHPRVHGEVTDLADLCRDAYRDVREAILGLRDASRPDRTLVEHLASYVEAFSRTSSIETRLETQGDDLRLTPAAEVQVIRVIQEALTNVRKHSGARRASVRISVGDAQTVFVVEDDGAGFDPRTLAGERDRFGLHTMRERTESVQGRLTIDSTPGRGTRLVVALPARHRLPPHASEELSA